MDTVSRAGLVLHEALYEYLSSLGERDSTKTRYLAGYLLSHQFREGGRDGYWKLVESLKLPIYR